MRSTKIVYKQIQSGATTTNKNSSSISRRKKKNTYVVVAVAVAAMAAADQLMSSMLMKRLAMSGKKWSLGKNSKPVVARVCSPKAGYLSNVEIVAPALRQLKFKTIMDEQFSVVLTAPMLEDLSWSCQCDFMNVGFGEIWYLSSIDLSMEDNVCYYILKLSLDAMVRLSSCLICLIVTNACMKLYVLWNLRVQLIHV